MYIYIGFLCQVKIKPFLRILRLELEFYHILIFSFGFIKLCEG